jgi:capsular polysaccharide export protein
MRPNIAAPGRGFLFLQGLAAWFFDCLGRTLLSRGHRVCRVNFNGGDRVFWRLPGAVIFAAASPNGRSFSTG